VYGYRDGLVVSLPASSAKSARGPKHESWSDQTLTSLGVTVSVLVGLAIHYRHVTAVSTMFTLNCLERLSDVL
jgi:hypothetical protein